MATERNKIETLIGAVKSLCHEINRARILAGAGESGNCEKISESMVSIARDDGAEARAVDPIVNILNRLVVVEKKLGTEHPFLDAPEATPKPAKCAHEDAFSFVKMAKSDGTKPYHWAAQCRDCGTVGRGAIGSPTEWWPDEPLQKTQELPEMPVAPMADIFSLWKNYATKLESYAAALRAIIAKMEGRG